MAKVCSKAFNLVEMSVVLTVLGLIAATIMSASSLIKASKLNSIGYDFRRFETAVFAFKDKYGWLPGDMPNASSYWPNCDPTPSNCNGNGNGFIELSSSAVANEAYRGFQHLSLAYLIEGDYTGTASGCGDQANIGTTVPQSKWLQEAGYFFNHFWQNGYSPATVSFGSFLACNQNDQSAMAPADALNLDLKFDDGMPSTGKLWAAGGWNGSVWDTSCTVTNGTTYSTTNTYTSLSDPTLHCRMAYFILPPFGY